MYKFLEASDIVSADPSTILCEYVGKGIGAGPVDGSPKALANGTKIGMQLASKEVTALATKTIATKATQIVKSASKASLGKQASQKSTEIAEKQFLKNVQNTATPIWSSNKNFNSVENAFDHWKRHGKEFPQLINAKQYAEHAKSFLNGSDILVKTRKSNGDLLRYQTETNTFVSFNKHGIPKTMFKPSLSNHPHPTNLEYFYAQ